MLKTYSQASVCSAVNVQWNYCPSGGVLLYIAITLKHAVAVCEINEI